MTGQEKKYEISVDGDLMKDDFEKDELVKIVPIPLRLNSYRKPEKISGQISDKIQRVLFKASHELKKEVERLYLELKRKMAIKGGEIIYTIIALYVRACFHQGTGKTLAQVVRIFKGKYPELTIRKLRKVYNSVKLI